MKILAKTTAALLAVATLTAVSAGAAQAATAGGGQDGVVAISVVDEGTGAAGVSTFRAQELSGALVTATEKGHWMDLRRGAAVVSDGEFEVEAFAGSSGEHEFDVTITFNGTTVAHELLDDAEPHVFTLPLDPS